jgi:SAM-dependent methyltransferase
MDINYFEKAWSRKNINKIASQSFWNGRAEEFNQKVYSNESENRLEKILLLLSSKGILKSDDEVLDIGCGPGKYAIEFAKKTKSVTGIDVSKKMIEYAKENASIEGLTNTNFRIEDWEEFDIDTIGWNKKFNLVFASMCPAINSKAALLKMINASCGHCFLSSFVEREDEVKDFLGKNVMYQNSNSGNTKTIYCSFNILWLMGFFPEITYFDTTWENIMPIDKAVEFYCSYFETTQNLSSEQKNFIRNHLEKIEKDGAVKEIVKAKIAWMLWKV